MVPPPPDKQAVGRFETNFVEARRAALEKMLNKSAAHPTLQHDADLKLFLESESFSADIKHKERREPNLGESKGMFSSLGLGGFSGGCGRRHGGGAGDGADGKVCACEVGTAWD